MDFKDRVIVVTGASSGMGSEAVKRFAANGAKVVINFVSNEDGATATADAINKAGGSAIIVQADVSEPGDADRLIAATVGEYGGIDVLVNNAGTTRFVSFDDMDALTPEAWTRLYEVNVMGAFFCSRAAAKEMRKRGRGAIINNASVSGQRPNGSSIAYCASKAALLQLTACLAVTLGPEIRVNSVSPGYIEDTLWTAKRNDFDPARAREQAIRQAVLGRVGSAIDVAGAILFLASDEAAYITGEDIRVDGGRYFRI